MQQFLLFFIFSRREDKCGCRTHYVISKGLGRLLERDRAHLLSSGEKHHHHQHFRHSTRVPLTSAFLTQPKTKSVFFKLSPSLRTCNPNSFVPLRASVASPHPWACFVYADKSFGSANYGLYWLPETKLELQGGEKKTLQQPNSLFNSYMCRGKKGFPLPRY